ncbi:hypothetical protein CCY99_07025 [Helicobacter sp. 16-1353]|uniref:DNA alkylation repair protein n=1 Tax=Helicobacter sp. 16-1353 TaxID=2004996 RepID=UPI000DCC1F5D|nr:DNA alkylation repair protein [Helicobacter sp. 16-1353]RAX52715.1 hypothetical protein CCY99_07025 [Helicobacter sp. 16-1353]
MNNFIKCELEKHKDSKYAEFSTRLTPTKYKIMGVKIPMLRDIAKRFCKHYKNDILRYLQNPLVGNFEEIMIYGMIIGNLAVKNDEILPSPASEIPPNATLGGKILKAKIPQNEILQNEIPKNKILVSKSEIESYIIKFMPYIDNWAICDVFSMGLKNLAKQNNAFDFILKLLHKNAEFEVRFALVALNSHFVNDKYITRILELAPTIRHDGYYVKMALAWLISTCYIKFSDKTMPLFKNRSLDKWTHNKAISKISDSLRVGNSDKIMLKNMRIK